MTGPPRRFPTLHGPCRGAAVSRVPDAVRALVVDRDRGRCLRCGGPGSNLHHRTARGMGGAGPRANSPANLIVLCGSGTTGCHGWVEAHPTAAAILGYRVPRGTDPATVPVLDVTGWVRLGHDGTAQTPGGGS